MPPTRNARLNVRLTAREHEALASRARACGLTISELVRRRCLEDDGRPRIVVDAEELQALYRDQKRIGGLLNQLLRHANSHRQEYPQVAPQAQQTLRLLADSTREISKLIADAKASA